MTARQADGDATICLALCKVGLTSHSIVSRRESWEFSVPGIIG